MDYQRFRATIRRTTKTTVPPSPARAGQVSLAQRVTEGTRPLQHPMPPPLSNPIISTACQNAAAAFTALSTLAPTARANILDAIAAALDTHRENILHTCAEETALTIEELTPEFARMTGTLRMFATLIRDGSWVRAAIDTPISPSGPHPAPNRNPNLSSPPLIGPNHDLRSLLIPLGPVAVFGSSNFPLAYGVCGGDTASALAAGCPVIIKEHPAHPITGRLLSSIALTAIKDAIQNPRGHAGATEAAPQPPTPTLLQYIHNESPTDFSIAQQLIQHPAITAVGFTGSTTGGLALHNIARSRHYPIPVFAEMGSLNSVFVCPGAFARRSESIADELAASVLARVGQQCTKPGIVYLPGANEHIAFYRMMCERLLAPTPRRMLARSVADNYYRRLDIVAASDGIKSSTPLPSPTQRDAMLGVPVVFSSSDIAMENWRETLEETFGPAIIIAKSDGSAQFQLDGRLTTSIYADPDDIDGSFVHHDHSGQAGYAEWGEFAEWTARVLSRPGRITFNGPPTGVRVATSTVHGGPFPATNRPDTTAVGPRAIERWCRPICFQNCPDALLPAPLQNANPLNICRTVNGELTRAAL